MEVNMRVLVITNLAPIKENSTGGIFIVKRLEQYPKFGVDYTAVSLSFKDSWAFKLLKRVLKKGPITPLEQLGNVRFNTIYLQIGLIEKVLSKMKLHDFDNFSWRFADKIGENFEISSYDLIHAHGMYEIPAGEIAYILSQRFKKLFVVTLHGSDVNLLMRQRRSRYVQILESAARVIFVSKKLLDTAKSLGYSGKNAVVIPNGYDSQIFKILDKEAVRKELGIYKENTHYVGFVGNLELIKRADKLPEIFRNISKGIDRVSFIVVGDGDLRKEIEKQTRGMDIIFTGRLPQEAVAKYMNAMDVMILPSRNEGFGAVCIEAQACGTCVVGSSNGGITEAIGFEEYVVEEGERFEERFARRVVEVLNEGYDRDRLIQRAKDFTWEEMVRREIEVYRGILSSDS
jgi:glycosyltransferase involved in cell wall biosynthesis